MKKTKEVQLDINEIYAKACAKLTPESLPLKDRIALTQKFRSVMPPAYDNHHIDAILDNPAFKQYEQNQQRKQK